LADAAGGRVAGERLAGRQRHDGQVGLVGVEVALPAGVGLAVDVLDRVATAGQRPAQVDLERVPGEVVHQDAQAAVDAHGAGGLRDVDDVVDVLDHQQWPVRSLQCLPRRLFIATGGACGGLTEPHGHVLPGVAAVPDTPTSVRRRPTVK
jgi:hypothetical protein